MSLTFGSLVASSLSKLLSCKNVVANSLDFVLPNTKFATFYSRAVMTFKVQLLPSDRMNPYIRGSHVRHNYF